MPNKPTYKALEQRLRELEKSNYELKRAEEVLQESETLFRNLFEHHDAVQLIIDPDSGDIIDANGAAEAFYGWRQEQLQQMRIQDINILSSEEIKQEMEKARTKQRIHFEFHHRRADGSIRDVEVFSSKIEAKGKGFLHSVIHDITARKQAEQALRESEEVFNSFLENSPIYVFFKDKNIKSVRLSKNYEQMIGRPLNEILGKTMDELFPSELAKKMIADDKKIINEGKLVTVDEEFNGRYYTTTKFPIVVDEENVYLAGYTTDITERKQSEAALVKEKMLSDAMLDGLPGIFYVFDRNGRFLRWNRNLETISGHTANEISQMTSDLFILEEERPALREAIGRVFTEGWATVEASFLLKDGSTAPYLLTGTCFDIEGSPYLAGLGMDISEHKQAEQALRESEDLLSSIYRAAPTGIGVVSNRILLTVNDRICEMTGHSRKSLIGKSARILYPSDADFEYVGRAKYRQILASGTGTLETRWQRKDGRVIDVLMSSTPIDPQDLAAGVTFTALDITERKQAEMKLRRSHQTFLTVLDGIDATVYVADMHSHEILFMNKHMIDTFGGDFTGRICYEAFRRESAPCGHCTNERLLDADGHPTGVCVWETKNPLTDKWYINHDRAIQWLDGRMARLQIAFDVTLIKEMEQESKRIGEQLKQAQKMESVGRLAGGVAHDFNNMLGAILGYAELGLLGVSPTDPIHGTLKDIQKAAQRSADLTRQLLAFARKQTVTPKVLDLNETVEGMLNMLGQLIGENIDLAWQPGKDLGPVRMDPSQIEQLLANLCVNARDAIHDTGKITVETGTVTFDENDCAAHVGSAPGAYVLLAVSDNGCGMDAETRSHLFEPFFTTKEVGKGTGLGLATVYGMVQQNNGFIDVFSQPGQGATFKIYLPRHAPETGRTAKTDAAQPDARGHETILLVEDEPMILDIAVKILERQGYTVMAAATPGEAIRLAREHAGEIHLLMTDVVMPEMNGRDLAKNLLSLYPNLKRLFMSGYTADIIAHHGVLDEGVQFIQKPFSVQTLAVKVREVLDETK
jgi:PAS domain S-box-containing protein